MWALRSLRILFARKQMLELLRVRPLRRAHRRQEFLLRSLSPECWRYQLPVPGQDGGPWEKSLRRKRALVPDEQILAGTRQPVRRWREMLWRRVRLIRSQLAVLPREQRSRRLSARPECRFLPTL